MGRPYIGKFVVRGNEPGWWLNSDGGITPIHNTSHEREMRNQIWKRKITVDHEYLPDKPTPSASNFAMCFMGWIKARNLDAELCVEAWKNRIAPMAFQAAKQLLAVKSWDRYSLIMHDSTGSQKQIFEGDEDSVHLLEMILKDNIVRRVMPEAVVQTQTRVLNFLRAIES